MNFFYVPLIFTAIIYYIQIYICEKTAITQFITYSPQWWTLILPVIYLILSIRKKNRIGIIVNCLLVCFCLSAFLLINSIPMWDKTVSTIKEKPEEYISLHFNESLGFIEINEGQNVYFSYKPFNYKVNINKEETNIEEFEEKYTVKIDNRLKAAKYHTENFDIYYIECTAPYFSQKNGLAENIYDYVNKNSKTAIIFGDLGFPKRGLNYEFISQKFNDCSKLYAYSLLQTKYILTTKDLTPYYFSNFHRATDGNEFRIKIK